MAELGDERGVRVERHLRRGAPSEEIVDAAAGSTTERVVRLTTVPTLVVGGAGAGDG